jgi:hypothetical protein
MSQATDIARIRADLDNLAMNTSEIKRAIDKEMEKLEAISVTQAEFKPVRVIAYSFCAIILTSAVSTTAALVVSKWWGL